jgi:LysM repeat protein
VPRAPSRLARVAAPLAFLLAATIGILLVRSAIRAEPEPQPRPATTAAGTTTQASTTTAPPTEPTTTEAPERFYVVQEGDTLATIAESEGTTVERLLELNPGIDPVALSIGQRIRTG